VESVWRGDTAVMPTNTVAPEDLERKAREFRRKKLVKTTGMPSWYKNRHGGRQHVLSGAARVRKFRPGTQSNTSFF
jgi:sec-independent protein translocase protein TatB